MEARLLSALLYAIRVAIESRSDAVLKPKPVIAGAPNPIYGFGDVLFNSNVSM